jgi:hypothetical protein
VNAENEKVSRVIEAGSNFCAAFVMEMELIANRKTSDTARLSIMLPLLREY